MLIDSLFDEVRTLNESEENQRRMSLWNQVSDYSAQSCFKGAPKKELRRQVPFTVDLGSEIWPQVLGYKIKEYFYPSTVKHYLEAHLRMRIFKFKHLEDDTPLLKQICLPWRIAFEYTLFGINEEFNEKTGPWISHQPILKNAKDFNSLSLPDFYKSGIMPLYHRFYEKLRKILPLDFELIFPDFARGPLGIAEKIRGTENFLIDLIIHPEICNKLLRFIVRARKKYCREKAEFLGKDIAKAALSNDDIDSPIISPKIYEDFLLSLEKEISIFQGGISNWHSCGNTLPFWELIKQIPHIDLMYIRISPQISLNKAMKVFSGNQPIEIALDPIEHILTKDLKQIKGIITQILDVCYDHPISLRIWGIRPLHSLKTDLSYTIQVCKVVQEITKGRKSKSKKRDQDGRREGLSKF